MAQQQEQQQQQKRFTPVEAGKYRDLRCSRYLHLEARGRDHDPPTDLEVRLTAEKTAAVGELLARLRQCHAVHDAAVVLHATDIGEVLGGLLQGMREKEQWRLFLTDVTIAASSIPGTAFANVADFAPNLLYIDIAPSWEVTLTLVGVCHTKVIRNRQAYALALSGLTLEALLAPVNTQGFEWNRKVGLRRASLYYTHKADHVASPDAWDEVQPEVFVPNCISFAKGIHEMYPAAVPRWTLQPRCLKCPYHGQCAKEAEGSLKMMTHSNALAKLSGVDAEANDGLVKIHTWWKGRRNLPQDDVIDGTELLNTDTETDLPGTLRAAMTGSPVLNQPAISRSFSQRRPDIEIVISIMYFNDKDATWVGGGACIFDYSSSQVEDPKRQFFEWGLGSTIADVIQQLEAVLEMCKGRTLQIYTVTQTECHELMALASEVWRRDSEEKYKNLASLCHGFPLDIFGGMDAFNERKLALRAADERPTRNLERNVRVREWLILAKNLGVSYNEYCLVGLETVFAGVSDICKAIGSLLNLLDDTPAGVLTYCTALSEEMARRSNKVLSLESLVKHLYHIPAPATMSSESLLSVFGCNIPSREDLLENKDIRGELHMRIASQGTRLLASRYLRGSEDEDGVLEFKALGRPHHFPFVWLRHATKTVTYLRYISQSYLKQCLTLQERSNIITFRVDSVVEDGATGVRTGSMSLVKNERVFRPTRVEGLYVLEGGAGTFNDFLYMHLQDDNFLWQELDDTAIGTFSHHPREDDAMRLQVYGSTEVLRVSKRTKTRWIKEGTILSARRRLIGTTFYNTATALLDDDMGHRLSAFLDHPRKYNEDPNKRPIGEVSESAVRDRVCRSLFASQTAVVRNALHKRVSVVCGPPGTGKTIALATAVASIVSERATGSDGFRVVVTAENLQPIRLLLDVIAQRVYHPGVVVCRMHQNSVVLHNNVNLGWVHHDYASDSRTPRFMVMGVIKDDFGKWNQQLEYNEKETGKNLPHMDDMVHKFNRDLLIAMPKTFDMCVVDEASQLFCRELPAIFSRMHPRARFIIAGDPLQMQPYADDRVKLPESATAEFDLPLHESLLLCMMRKRNSPDGNAPLLDKIECRGQLNPTFITKLSLCLRSHRDIADLTKRVYEAEDDEESTYAAPLARFDRWLVPHTPTPVPAEKQVAPPVGADGSAQYTEQVRKSGAGCENDTDPYIAEYSPQDNLVDESGEPVASHTFTISSRVFEKIFTPELQGGGRAVPQSLLGGLLAVEMDMTEDIGPEGYDVYADAAVVGLCDVIAKQYRRRCSRDEPLTFIVLYPFKFNAQTVPRFLKGSRSNVICGSPQALQGQSADVVIVNTRAPRGSKVDRYFCPLPMMNVCFSRAECLQVLIVPKLLQVSDQFGFDSDMREGMKHIQCFLNHPRVTKLCLSIDPSSENESDRVAVRRVCAPTRTQDEDSFNDEGVVPFVANLPPPIVTEGPAASYSNGGKKGGNRKGGKGGKNASVPPEGIPDNGPAAGPWGRRTPASHLD
eukprot:TRINITY_DN522_c0_g1_i5.p1 TRINITY_DN522_c0_g1~~TRINITY_DN522_c0_g1_i5.p1  ORF type:complete len:1528 (+),score=538.82 TRINITY_DN522_c0_g1_i5:60-4586(+)